MPTILDLLGVRIPTGAEKQFRGTSLAPVMKGESANRKVFSETDYRDYTFKRSIITPAGWKLIYTLEADARELYNLEDDPGETKNLAEEQSTIANDLQRKLFAHFKSIGHDLHNKEWKTGLNPVYRSQAKASAKN